MARKNTPTWPHDHSAKHAEAARLGWARRRRGGGAYQFGGKPSHTKKYLTKQTPRAKSAKKKVAPAQTDTFQLIATQKANGKWIVSRKYKSGRIKQEPGEFAQNPLGRKEKKARQHKGQSALFGGLYEQEKTYGSGLFG